MTVDAIAFWCGVAASVVGAVVLAIRALAVVSALPASLARPWLLPMVAVIGMLGGLALGAVFVGRYTPVFPVPLIIAGLALCLLCFGLNALIRHVAQSRIARRQSLGR